MGHVSAPASDASCGPWRGRANASVSASGKPSGVHRGSSLVSSAADVAGVAAGQGGGERADSRRENAAVHTDRHCGIDSRAQLSRRGFARRRSWPHSSQFPSHPTPPSTPPHQHPPHHRHLNSTHNPTSTAVARPCERANFSWRARHRGCHISGVAPEYGLSYIAAAATLGNL